MGWEAPTYTESLRAVEIGGIGFRKDDSLIFEDRGQGALTYKILGLFSEEGRIGPGKRWDQEEWAVVEDADGDRRKLPLGFFRGLAGANIFKHVKRIAAPPKVDQHLR